MSGTVEKITKGQDHLGQPCVVCGEAIAETDQVVVCPRCRSIHHADCWKGKGGCGRKGCRQVAVAVRGEPPKGDGPPPPVSKNVILGGVLLVAALLIYLVFRPQPPDPAQGRTKITFLGEAGVELNEVLTGLSEDWNNSHGEIYIDLQLVPPGALDPKLVVLIAAEQAPDVISISEDRFSYFVEQGALLALAEDGDGKAIYGVDHPAQLAKLVIWGGTEHPAEAREVLRYLQENIPPVDRGLLKETQSTPLPLFSL